MLAPSKFTLSDAVKFGGTIISSEKIKNEQIIFLDPPDSRILAINDNPTPTSKNAAIADIQQHHHIVNLDIIQK